jgi:hypothetical protein
MKMAYGCAAKTAPWLRHVVRQLIVRPLIAQATPEDCPTRWWIKAVEHRALQASQTETDDDRESHP